MTRVLTKMAFPGVDKPDHGDGGQVDLDAADELRYAPTPPLRWAWRQLREVDGVRDTLTGAGGAAPPPTFERTWHLLGAG